MMYMYSQQIGGYENVSRNSYLASWKSCTVPFTAPQTVATGHGLFPLPGSPLVNDMGATFNSTQTIIPVGVSRVVMYGA